MKAALACALLACTAAAAAQTAAPAPTVQPPASAPSKGEAKARRDFQLLDFNGDGKLSRAEVRLFPRLAAAFDDADTDSDGYVSFDEVQVFAAKYRAQRDRAKARAAAQAASQAAGGD